MPALSPDAEDTEPRLRCKCTTVTAQGIAYQTCWDAEDGKPLAGLDDAPLNAKL